MATYSFPDIEIGRALRILSGSLTVEPGDIFVVEGPNGCGKSTLLRLMAGLPVDYAQPRANSWELPWRAIGYVCQDYDSTIFPWLSVESNIAFYRSAPPPLALSALLADFPRPRERSHMIRSLAKSLRLPWLDRTSSPLSNTLSGGMRQRLALAKELSVGSGLILLDEPFSSQARQWITPINDAIEHCAASLATIGVITHDLDRIRSPARRFVFEETSSHPAFDRSFYVHETQLP